MMASQNSSQQPVIQQQQQYPQQYNNGNYNVYKHFRNTTNAYDPFPPSLAVLKVPASAHDKYRKTQLW